MTLTQLRAKLKNFWIFIFFGVFLIIFIFLYLIFNPNTQPTKPEPTKTSSIPESSKPVNDPFANKPQKYQIDPDVYSYTPPKSLGILSITKTPIASDNIANMFNFDPADFRELQTDLGTRKVYINQNRTLTIDDLTITYRNPQTNQQISTLELITDQAQNTLNKVGNNSNLQLSAPQFYRSTNLNDQTVDSFDLADTISFDITTKHETVFLATDRTPNTSVGSITFDKSGSITSFSLVVFTYNPTTTVQLISLEQAVSKLAKNQSTITQIRKLSGTKDEEEAYYTSNYKNINITSVQTSYFFPTTKNPQTIYPFFTFSGTAISKDNQEYLITLNVEATN